MKALAEGSAPSGPAACLRRRRKVFASVGFLQAAPSVARRFWGPRLEPARAGRTFWRGGSRLRFRRAWPWVAFGAICPARLQSFLSRTPAPPRGTVRRPASPYRSEPVFSPCLRGNPSILPDGSGGSAWRSSNEETEAGSPPTCRGIPSLGGGGGGRFEDYREGASPASPGSSAAALSQELVKQRSAQRGGSAGASLPVSAGALLAPVPGEAGDAPGAVEGPGVTGRAPTGEVSSAWEPPC